MGAADTTTDSAAPTRRPVLLHSRSAMLPSSSLTAAVSSRSSALPSAVGLPRPALTAQRSLQVVGSAGVHWRTTVAAAERSRISSKLGMQLAACQLDVEQLLTLAACMAEEALYERAESRLDYMKRSVELQHTIARLPLPPTRPAHTTTPTATTLTPTPTPSTYTAPASSSTDSSESLADVTGLLALAQSSVSVNVEQKQSELNEWGQRSTGGEDEDEAGPTSSLGEEMRKRRRERSNTSGSGRPD